VLDLARHRTAVKVGELHARWRDRGHIAIVQENLRELIEQAAAFSGAEDEERNADRIADQEAKLAELEKQRDALLGKK